MIPSDITGLDGRLVGVAGGAAFLLCRRAAGLNRHASQWALPGGRLDPGEGPVDAALRELDEELGVRLDESSVLGLLDDYPTRSGYVITPVVVWGGGDLVLRPDPGEVLAAYRVGLHELCRDDSPRFVSIPESDRPVVQVPLGGDLIHAPTGAVLVQFRWVALDGRAGERVHEFEQPVFACGVERRSVGRCARSRRRGPRRRARRPPATRPPRRVGPRAGRCGRHAGRDSRRRGRC